MSEQNSFSDLPSTDDRQMAMLTHALGFAGLVIPFGNLIGPLIVWLMKRENHPLIEHQGKESLNFQISYTIYYLVLIFGITYTVVDDPENYMRWGILVALLFLLFIVYVVFIIIGSVKANQGKYYRYPFIIRFIQ